MQKLIAIFLAIGIVNAGILQLNSSRSSSSQNVLSALSALSSSNSTAPASDVRSTVEGLAAKSVKTLGPVLSSVGPAFGVDLSEENIASELSNLPANPLEIVEGLKLLNGDIKFDSVLSILLKVVGGLLETVLGNPGSLLNIVKDLFLSAGQMDIHKVQGPIKELEASSNNGVTTMGAVMKMFAEQFNVPFNVEALPNEIKNAPVNVSTVASQLTEKYAKEQFGIKEVLGEIAPENTNLLNVIVSAPNNGLNAFSNLLSSAGDKKVDPNVLYEKLNNLKKRGNVKLYEIGEVFAEGFNMPFLLSNYPEELKNIPVNVDDIIGAVGKESKQSGNNGLLGVDNLVIALGQAVPSLLNVNAQVPNVALGLVSSLVSGLTGSLDVSSLLNVLGGMNSNANLNEIFSAVAGVTGGSLSGQLPSAIGSVTGVLAPLQKLLGSLGGGSISPEKFVGLIGSIVPQLLAVTPVQVLSGAVNQIIVGVVGLLNALLGGLLGGNGVAGGLLNGLLGGLSGGANSGVGNLLGSLTRSF